MDEQENRLILVPLRHPRMQIVLLMNHNGSDSGETKKMSLKILFLNPHCGIVQATIFVPVVLFVLVVKLSPQPLNLGKSVRLIKEQILMEFFVQSPQYGID